MNTFPRDISKYIAEFVGDMNELLPPVRKRIFREFCQSFIEELINELSGCPRTYYIWNLIRRIEVVGDMVVDENFTRSFRLEYDQILTYFNEILTIYRIKQDLIFRLYGKFRLKMLLLTHKLPQEIQADLLDLTDNYYNLRFNNLNNFLTPNHH